MKEMAYAMRIRILGRAQQQLNLIVYGFIHRDFDFMAEAKAKELKQMYAIRRGMFASLIFSTIYTSLWYQKE